MGIKGFSRISIHIKLNGCFEKSLPRRIVMTNQVRMISTKTDPTAISTAQLRAAFNGQVIAPGDSLYDQARTTFYGGFDRHPAAIVRVTDAADVSRGVSLARETGLELAVRSGGHSNAGYSVTEGGIVLDLSEMRALDINVERRTAWAQTGLTAAEYTAAAEAYGLVTGFGDTGSVGIGGLTLGGGVGYLVRKYGLTIDALLAAEIVTADGQILQIDAMSHPDLFWAIRGGGGNFGVATRFQFRLHRLNATVGGMLVLPATPGVLQSFICAAEEAPEELSTIANIMVAPPMPFLPSEVHGQLVILAMLIYTGDSEAGQRALAPFRALATPLADMLRPMRYTEIYPPEDNSYHPTGTVRSIFIDTLDRGAAETIVDRLHAPSSAMHVAQLRVLGGAMARVPSDATAFAHRRRRIMINCAALYQHPEEAAQQEEWVIGFASALRHRDDGVYVNFLGDEGQARVREAYPGPTWERLAAIKRQYDPTNLFRLNQNIPPAEESSSPMKK
jgi:hypothetical protein